MSICLKNAVPRDQTFPWKYLLLAISTHRWERTITAMKRTEHLFTSLLLGDEYFALIRKYVLASPSKGTPSSWNLWKLADEQSCSFSISPLVLGFLLLAWFLWPPYFSINCCEGVNEDIKALVAFRHALRLRSKANVWGPEATVVHTELLYIHTRPS